MSAMAFDTYTAAKRLRDAGFNEHQAEAAVTMVRDAVGADREARVTKADLDTATSGLESRLTVRMDTTRADLDAAISGLESRLTARMDAFEARMDATRVDLDAAISGLESRLTARMDTIEARMDAFATKTELAALETRLTHRLYAVVLAAVAANGLIAAALKAL